MEELIVEYKNTLNSIPLSSLNSDDLDLFMFLCSKVKGKGSTLLKIPYLEIKKAIGREEYNNKYFTKYLERLTKKLANINICFSDELSFEQFNLFPTFIARYNDYYDIRFGNVEGCTLIVRVNEDYVSLLNDLNLKFTSFELKEYVRLESKYSKNLYRLLKQWRFVGIAPAEKDKDGIYKHGIYDINYFREIMDCPEKYTSNDIMYKIIAPSIKELREKGCFNNLEVTCIRDNAKRGRPVKGYYFIFNGEQQIKKEEKKLLETETKPKKTNKQQVKPNPSNRFNNFTQRDYDYAELERKIILQNNRNEEE